MTTDIEHTIADMTAKARDTLRRELARLPTNSTMGSHVTADTMDAAIRALETSALELAHQAISSALLKSGTIGRFHPLQKTIHPAVLELVEVVDTWYRRELQLDSARLVNFERLEALRRRVDHQLDSRRAEFTSAVPTSQVLRKTTGRKPKSVWVGAINAAWGEIYRGDLKPHLHGQVAIENAITDFCTKAGEESSESTVRGYASLIFEEATKEA